MSSKTSEAEDEAVFEPAEAVEETEAAPDEKSTESAEDERRPRRTFKINDRLVTIVAIVVALLAIGTAGIQWTKAEQNGAKQAKENKVRMKASEFVLAFFNYDYSHLDHWQKRMTELSTNDYSKKVLVSFTGFDKSIVEMKTVSSATIRDSYVTEPDGSNAKAFVVVDSQAKSTPGTLFRTGMKMMLSMVEQKGTWKINEVTALGPDTENWIDPNGKPMESPVSTADSASPSPSASASP
jgi:Mce-associated membrane protein